MSAIPAEIEQTARDLVVALRAYRKAKGNFADAYERRKVHDRSAAEAQTDLDNAMRNGTWLQGEVAAYGAALAALCLSQMGEPK